MALTPKQRIAAATAIATAIAIPAEGLRQNAYKDVASVVTICYGHTGPDVKIGNVSSIEGCKAMLSQDMQKSISTVDRCQPGLPIPVLAAFSDATFNLGSTVACDTTSSTAARLLKVRDYTGACNQLLRWDRARVAGMMMALPGLTKRRNLERDVCLTWAQS